ncbi:hypothetical protein BATDEDRAFT_11622, partial [Batrachochytrium dendrobatidis JAM81]
TFFDELPSSYTTVTISNADNAISTVQFLDSTHSLTRLFNNLGSAFSIVSTDMHGNITKIRASYDKDPTKCGTLQELVKTKLAAKETTGVDALLWLKRGLQFTASGLRRNLNNPTEELSVSFNKAYEGGLSKHHNFMIRNVFSLAMKVCPSRADFYAKLAGSDPAKMKEQLEAWLAALEKQVAIIDEFLRTLNIEK